jgi:hypothetical protein
MVFGMGDGLVRKVNNGNEPDRGSSADTQMDHTISVYLRSAFDERYLLDMNTTLTACEPPEYRLEDRYVVGTRYAPVDRMPECRQRSDMHITRAYIQAGTCCKLVSVGEDLGDVVEDLERKDGLILGRDGVSGLPFALAVMHTAHGIKSTSDIGHDLQPGHDRTSAPSPFHSDTEFDSQPLHLFGYSWRADDDGVDL